MPSPGFPDWTGNSSKVNAKVIVQRMIQPTAARRAIRDHSWASAARLSDTSSKKGKQVTLVDSEFENTDRQIEMDLIVVGGKVVNAGGSTFSNILISEGRIQAVQDPALPLPPCKRIIDATGKMVLPGGVDPHCHIALPLGDYTSLDDYETASIAALWGGTTTVIDFAIPEPGQSPLSAVEHRREMAKVSRCDTALHGCVIQWNDSTAFELSQMASLGVRTIKLFTTYRDGVMAGPDTVLEVLRKLHTLGGIAYVHAEADHVINDSQQHAVAMGYADASRHPQTRPEIAEAAAVAQVLAIAEHVQAPVYFVHQSTHEAIDLVRDARRRGVRAYTECCPHYLSLDSSVYASEEPAKYVCCPPIRSARTLAMVQSRALAGDVDAVGSDHCCYSMGQKKEHAGDVTKMPNGMPGVETRLPVTYTQLVARGGMSIERFVAMVATNPAKLNGLDRKGYIAPGGDADVVVIDVESYRPVKAAELHMESDYTPYEGIELTGWPVFVISSGRVVVDYDGFHDPGPLGRALNSAALANSLIT